MIFKGSLPIDMFLYLIERYLGSRTRLRPKNSSVGVIFDVQQSDHTIFDFSEISNNLGFRSESSQYHSVSKNWYFGVFELVIDHEYAIRS